MAASTIMIREMKLFIRSCSFLLHFNISHKTNSPSFSPFKLVQVAGSEIEMKNFTNPGLA